MNFWEEPYKQLARQVVADVPELLTLLEDDELELYHQRLIDAMLVSTH